MAKGKHATALFEVIHSARRPPLNSPAVKMPPPRSWWKGRAKRVNSVEDLHVTDAHEPAVPAADFSQTPVFSKASVEAPPAPRRMTVPEPQPPEPVYTEPRYIDHLEPAPIEPMPELPPTRSTERSVQVNSGDGAFSFRLSYGGAAAAGFILLLLIAIAFLAGTRNADIAPTEEDALASAAPAQAEPSPSEPGMLAAVSPSSTVQAASPSSTALLSTPATVVDQTAPVAAPSPLPAAHRQVGMNYVIVQSYPSAEAAQRATDFLLQNGIPCTIKQGLPGWTLSNWYTIIGIQPFDHIQHNAELDRYKEKVRRLGVVFAGRNLFNRFEPSVYSWRAEADDDTAQ